MLVIPLLLVSDRPFAISLKPHVGSEGGALLFATGSQDVLDQPAELYVLPRGQTAATAIDFKSPSLSLLALDPVGRGVHFDWMGEDPIIYAHPAAGGRSDWFRLSSHGPVKLTGPMRSPPTHLEAVGRQTALALDDTGLWRLTPDGSASPVLVMKDLKAVEPIDSNLAGPEPIDAPSERAGTSVVADGAEGTLAYIDLRGEQRTMALSSHPDPLSRILQASRIAAAGQRSAVRVKRDAHGVDRVDLVRTGAPPVQLLTLNRQFDAVEWSSPIAIDHPSSTGDRLKDWLYLPPNAKPGASYPLVVLGYPTQRNSSPPHGGRPGADQVDDNPQLVAAAGFAVLVPSLPKTGEDFIDGMTQAVLEAVDRASKIPGVDGRRLGFWGHSAGGLLAFKLAAESGRFKAFVAAAGPSDIISFRGQVRPSSWLGRTWDGDERFPVGWSELGGGGLKSTPFTDLAHYLRASPVFSADKIKTPILIVQGDQDPVAYPQGEEMFSTLYRERKDALFMTFFGEAHTISSPPNLRLYYNTAFEFLRRELGG